MGLIMDILKDNPHLSEHMEVDYDENLVASIPMGAWFENPSRPVDESEPLKTVEEAAELSKKDILAYLKKAAPREVLIEQELTGNVQLRSKSLTKEGLLETVAQVWALRSNETSQPQTIQSESRSSRFLAPLAVGLQSEEASVETIELNALHQFK